MALTPVESSLAAMPAIRRAVCRGQDSAAVLTASFLSDFSVDTGESDPDFDALGVVVLARLSLTYHPDPLKITPDGYTTRRTLAPQAGQSRIGSSEKLWRTSKR